MEQIKVKKYKRRFITLIEIMIVMFLIALITGVLAYNFRGSLDEGKAFKTKSAIERIETYLNLAAADDSDLMNHVESEWQNVIKESPMVQNPDALLKDGWGGEFSVTVENNIITVRSQKYDDYKRSHKTMFNDEAK